MRIKPEPLRPSIWDRDSGRIETMPDAYLHKSFDCQVKADDDTGSFDLYAAVFGNIDRQDEVISPGAFKNLPEFVADGMILMEHNLRSLPVGLIESASQDEKGLRIRGRFHSTPEAQACRTVILERMAAGKGVKCSIGYKTDDFTYEKIQGKTVCRLKAVRVYEASFVNLPANPQAGVTSAKSLEAAMPDESKPSLIEAIKDWLGLAVKKGRAISKANHAALSTFADAMAEHGAKSTEHSKSLKAMAKEHADHGEVAGKLAEEMKGYLKQFGEAEAESEDDDEPDEKAAAAEDLKAKALRLRLRLRSRA